MGEEPESGLKWWVRYVIVPVIATLVGGGGVAAYIFATKDRPPQEQPKTENESVFFASSKSSAHVEKEIVIPMGQNVTLHWEVKNPPRGTLSILTMTTNGKGNYSDMINPYGLITYTPTETTDYYLVDREGPFKGTTLGGLRVVVVN